MNESHSMKCVFAAVCLVATTALLSSCHGGDWDLPADLPPLQITPAAGIYSDPNQEIVITSPDPGVTIKYTTDGSNPINSGTTHIYSGPLHLGGSGVVELRAYSTNGGDRSPVDSVQYDFPIPWDSPASVTWGSVLSGGRTYRTVLLGNQRWMAENLNDPGPAGTTGTCPKGDTVYCREYGRLYSWSEAMGIDKGFNTGKWGGSERDHQGICPAGWHIPDDSEWNVLFGWVISATGNSEPGRYLKSSQGWPQGAGLDLFGFRVLPAGTIYDYLGYSAPGGFGIFWKSTQAESVAWSKSVDFPGGGDSIMNMSADKWNRQSVRCLMD
jgi:uncharacterized protein (TIGR02145 family)